MAKPKRARSASATARKVHPMKAVKPRTGSRAIYKRKTKRAP